MLAQDNYNFHFSKDMCSIYFENKLVACAFLIDELYYLHTDASVNINEQIINAIGSKRPKDKISQKYLRHFRLGHIGEDRLNKLEKDNLLEPLTSKSYLVCEFRLQEKIAKLPFVGQGERAIEILALVHIDACGPLDIQVRSSYVYFITFIDDYLQYNFIYLMHRKSEAFKKFIEFRHEVEK